MKLLSTATIAALASIITACVFEVVQARYASVEAGAWLPEGTLLLIGSSTSCPTNWSARAPILASLDVNANDDFSFQDFDYLVRNQNEQVVRLQTCQKVQ